VGRGTGDLELFEQKLFVLDLANNHFGSVVHALKTIDAISKSVGDLGQRVAIKLQLRDLDTYIHPDFADRTDLHYVKRFMETRLSIPDFKEIAQHCRSHNFIPMATPFDEQSCEDFQEIGFDIAKIASASANDGTLLKAIAGLGKPTIASTGGLTENEVVRLHDALRFHAREFAIMHCVSIYPSPDNLLHLRQISNFLTLFPRTAIGWSTHEEPTNMFPVAIATALGATIFERHVGLSSDQYKLNAYSSEPGTIRSWIEAALLAETISGSVERLPTSPEESQSLIQLRRGIFARRNIEAGKAISPEDLYSAFPLQRGGMLSGDPATSKLVALSDIPANGAITPELASPLEFDDTYETTNGYLFQVRKILSRSKVPVNKDAVLELSHHYGLSRFREFGTAMFTCLNRNYAKKILVMLPRQKHPIHYHDMKEESFQLLWGDVQISVNGKVSKLEVGEILTVYPKEWHKFSSMNGCVLEEISTHHSSGDSFYEDPTIQSLSAPNRKTLVRHLGFLP